MESVVVALNQLIDSICRDCTFIRQLIIDLIIDCLAIAQTEMNSNTQMDYWYMERFRSDSFIIQTTFTSVITIFQI